MNRITVLADAPGDVEPLVVLDGLPLPVGQGEAQEFESAPFQRHVLMATAAEGLEPGVRPAFAGWEDGTPGEREFVSGLGDTTLVARYEGEEVRMAIQVSSPVQGVQAGLVRFEPESADGWLPRGETVTVFVEATTGFGFGEWTGDLSGSENPQAVQAADPLTAVAEMVLTYGVSGPDGEVEVEAAAPVTLSFAVEDATYPVSWRVESGELPEGLVLSFDGTVSGNPMEMGDYPISIRARDARSLEAGVDLVLRVTEPRIGIETLVGPFLLSGTGPTAPQKLFLDRTGNLSGSYDLGDFRAFLIRNPDLPMAAQVREQIQQLIRLGPVSGPGGEGP
jgi:hypothetical protein